MAKRVAFGVLSAMAVVMVRKAVERVWERATGEAPPTKGGRKHNGHKHNGHKHNGHKHNEHKEAELRA